ncbi:MAG: hypothetical protein QF673_01900, partial [Candidatus Hydrothermarchaeota archaeon]|nr:hypothetical protein [Candidatus Hydrothermarchaeota archaeon]
MSFTMPLNLGSDLEEILTQALDEKRLSREQGLCLLSASPEDSFAIASAANSLARHRTGRTATYVVNRNINFTNVCINNCSFCAFHRDQRSP